MNTLTNESDGYVLQRTAEEHERLVAQARVLEPVTRHALDRAGLAAGHSALDVGCGPGEVMRLMAERVGASGRVTGIDIDQRIGSYALTRLRRDGPDVYRFIAADATTLQPIDGAPFDFVFARLFLFHMDDPVRMLQRLWQWVAPGGTLLVMDYDCTVIRSIPPQPVIDRALALVLDALSVRLSPATPPPKRAAMPGTLGRRPSGNLPGTAW